MWEMIRTTLESIAGAPAPVDPENAVIATGVMILAGVVIYCGRRYRKRTGLSEGIKEI